MPLTGVCLDDGLTARTLWVYRSRLAELAMHIYQTMHWRLLFAFCDVNVQSKVDGEMMIPVSASTSGMAWPIRNSSKPMDMHHQTVKKAMMKVIE